MDTKVCIICGKELPATLEYFHKKAHGKFGLRTECKKCRSDYKTSEAGRAENRQRRANNPEVYKEAGKRRYRKNKARILEYQSKDNKRYIVVYAARIHRKYGLRLDQVSDMLDDQKGCCAICKESLVTPDCNKTYAIDHDHKTGKVRGLLCSLCNQSLGGFRDNTTYIREAINYLENNQCQVN